MKEEEIQVGKGYEGKRGPPRYVVWISELRTQVQYDSDSVRVGRSYPTTTMKAFANWATREIKPSEKVSK